MRERTFRDLEFDRILEMISRHCLSEQGRRSISPDALTCDADVLEKRADKIADIMNRLSANEVQLQRFAPIDHLLESAARSHASFDGEDIYAAGEFIASLDVLGQFLEEELVWPDLRTLSADILLAISSDGSVKETHPLLLPLFRKAEEVKARRFAYSQNFVSSHQELTQNLNAVYRNERVVLPVVRERKSEVPGYIQGSSASGNTLYIEPFELVDLNNQVVEAQEEIQRAKLKIINDLSLRVRAEVRYLGRMEKRVADFDFHYASACFIMETHSNRAIFSDRIVLIGARHPLLGDKAVPVSLTVENGIKGVVLSGANAGGKTVTMKTVALFVLIAELTGYAPFDEGSALPLYRDIYTDIGDGQSITENFSTFSGHMSNVSSICRAADSRSLILLDEIGSGTDPDEGAALTISLLDYLKTRAGCIFVTSHYGQVKLYAYNSDDMLNASMEFDEASAEPTYHVISGLPGDSHAIEIAKRMGIPKEVVKSARARLGTGESVSRIIAELNGKQRALDRKITALELEKRTLQQREAELEAEKKKLEEERFRLKSDNADELSEYMVKTRRELEKLVKDISTGTLTREKTLRVKSFIKGIEERSEKADREVKAEDERLHPVEQHDYKVGDEVLCGAYGRRGVLLKNLGKGKWQVSLDNLRMTLSERDMKPAGEEKKATVSPYSITSPRPKLTLDVRGYTLEQALRALDEEIEGCLVHNISSFSVIHGYGNGILSQGIHSYLKKQKDVKEFYFANPEDGGMGKTYVLF